MFPNLRAMSALTGPYCVAHVGDWEDDGFHEVKAGTQEIDVLDSKGW